jgi:hypothetical protein
MIRIVNSTNSLLAKNLTMKLTEENLINRNLEIHIDSGEMPHSGEYSVLILEEPPTVKPKLYRESYLSKFNLVIHLSPWRARRYGSPFMVFQPISFPRRINSPSKFFRYPIIVLDLKFSVSKTSLYKLRRDLVHYLSKKNINCDLYGTNWNLGLRAEFRRRWGAVKSSMPNVDLKGVREAYSGFGRKYPLYKGWLEDKQSVISMHSLAVVIENDLESLSEKLFDCFLAGTVPIYIGPSLQDFTNLDQLCFQVEPNVTKIAQEILRITDKEIMEKEKAIKAYLDKTDLSQIFSQEVISSQIVRIILNTEF